MRDRYGVSVPSAKRDAGPIPMRPHHQSGGVPQTGEPLDAALRAHYEPRFAHDLSQVRVHTGRRADAAARSTDAVAYTRGNNIVFADGAYRPSTRAGRGLIAHELAHVVQQSRARSNDDAPRPAPSATTDTSAGGRAAEREADHLARHVEDALPGTGPARATETGTAVPALQRAPTVGGAAGKDPTEHLAGTLYARAPDGSPLPPSVEDIAQGGLNDCFLMGALAAIVSADPNRIKTMIAFGPNNTYTVTFKGIGFLSSAKQTVTADFAIGKHANLGPRKALWPLVIERAYAQEKGGLTEVDKGGNPGNTVDDFINDSASRFDPREKSADYIMGKVAKGKAKKWPMTALSPRQEDASKEKRAMTGTISGLHFWHTYAIVDVDAKGNRIKLFNPWGNDHPNGDGWIAVTDVRKFFVQIEIND